ncbi:hypothetical protein J3E74DRAFT_412049 [Bipolaris maydis]|nr:hypothetical protein J3E74DRAFT_412049 [Bipolaris maydis]
MATRDLSYDRINDSRLSTAFLTPSFMAMHIVRVFLFERRSAEPVRTPSSGSPATTIDSFCTAARPTPLDFNLISGYSSGVDHTHDFPTCTSSPPILNPSYVRKTHAQTPKDPVESLAASLVSGEPSSASSTHTSTTKRSASHLEFGAFDEERNKQRPVKRRFHFCEHELYSVGDPNYETHTANASHSTPSPTSVYIDETSSISQTDSARLLNKSDLKIHHHLEIAEPYLQLIEEWKKSNHGGPQSHMAVSRHSTSNLRQSLSASVATHKPQAVNPRKRPLKCVCYMSLYDSKLFLRVPRTKEATERFAASQDKEDKYSRFFYKGKQSDMIANNGKQLYAAIERYDLLIVWVDSNCLGKAE